MGGGRDRPASEKKMDAVHGERWVGVAWKMTTSHEKMGEAVEWVMPAHRWSVVLPTTEVAGER